MKTIIIEKYPYLKVELRFDKKPRNRKDNLMQHKMRTIVVNEPNNLVINETNIPIPKENEALLRVLFCGICGSDMLLYTGGHYFASYPRVPGHEFSAEIVEIPENDKGLCVGQIVTASPYFNCATCYPCLNGRVNCCENNRTMGVHMDGAFSEYIVMPISKIYYGKGIAPEKLALIEPFSIGYHAMKRANVKKGDNVLIVGAGPIGIFAMLAAKQLGANPFISDVMQGRLDFALSMGATGACNVADTDVSVWVKEVTGGHGMDVCAEASGSPVALLSCIENVCFAGRIVLIGNGKKETTFNHSILIKKELDVIGSRNSLNDFAPLIDIIKEDNFDIMRIVTSTYPFEKVNEAFSKLMTNDGSQMKILLDFN